MNLFEFEGKQLLAAYGMKVPRSAMVDGRTHASLPYPFVLKAQTLSGGRGKAGGIRISRNADEYAVNSE